VSINCNVCGAVDVKGDPLVVVALRDNWGVHQFVLPPGVAREFAQCLADQANRADALAAKVKPELVPDGDKPS